jgi:hypothetical protein
MPYILDTDAGAAFSDLLTEFYARGFSYLDDSGAGEIRAKGWINDVMHDVDDEEDWDYLRAIATGVPPLTISALGRVEAITDSSGLYQVQQADPRWLRGAYADLTVAGQPLWWYRTNPTTIATYPTTTSSITVFYFRSAGDLIAAGDTTLLPKRYRRVILELAAEQAYRDKSNHADADQALAAAGRVYQRMRQNMLVPPREMTMTGASVDS